MSNDKDRAAPSPATSALVKKIDDLYAQSTQGDWGYAAYCAVTFHHGKDPKDGDLAMICSTDRNDENHTRWPNDPPFEECDANAKLIAALYQSWPQIRQALVSETAPHGTATTDAEMMLRRIVARCDKDPTKPLPLDMVESARRLSVANATPLRTPPSARVPLCICESTAVEPDDDCPVHGAGPATTANLQTGGKERDGDKHGELSALVERFKALRVKYHSTVALDDFEKGLPEDYDGPIITAIQVANEIDFVCSKIVQALHSAIGTRDSIIEECRHTSLAESARSSDRPTAKKS